MCQVPTHIFLIFCHVHQLVPFSNSGITYCCRGDSVEICLKDEFKEKKNKLEHLKSKTISPLIVVSDFTDLCIFVQSHPGCPFPIYRAHTPLHAPAAATESNYHTRHNKVLKVVVSILCKKKKLGRREPDERRLVSVSLLEKNRGKKRGGSKIINNPVP